MHVCMYVCIYIYIYYNNEMLWYNIAIYWPAQEDRRRGHEDAAASEQRQHGGQARGASNIG